MNSGETTSATQDEIDVCLLVMNDRQPLSPTTKVLNTLAQEVKALRAPLCVPVVFQKLALDAMPPTDKSCLFTWVYNDKRWTALMQWCEDRWIEPCGISFAGNLMEEPAEDVSLFTSRELENIVAEDFTTSIRDFYWAALELPSFVGHA